MRKGILTTIVCVVVAVGLLACGGGGGGGTGSNTNTAPVANAGPDQNVSTGSVVTLNGSGSSDANSDPLTYSWSFTSKPASSTATLSSVTAVNPTFTADKDGAYVLSLVVNDGTVNSAADTVTITASTANSAPVANAGPDQNVSTGSVVTLNGSGSSDANSDPLTYSWSFTSKPASSAATLSSASAVNPTFTADREGSYVFSLVVNDGTVSSTADTVTVTAVNHVPVPDSGVVTKYTTTFGEDADYTINPPSYTDNGNGTITDNVTGLIWQKQDDATTRTWDDSNTYCSNNTPALPGTGWRLPTRMELLGIVNYGTSTPASNATYFPNTQSSYYWSSGIYATDATKAWSVYFGNGDSYKGYSRTVSNYVRCVRGQSATSSFTDNGNGTVTDNVTGLMWQQVDDTPTIWRNAIPYCENLTLASYTDWRLPNVKELSSLVDDTRSNPAFNPAYIVITSVDPPFYWSSSTLALDTTAAWSVNSYNGETGYWNKLNAVYVRCVRGQ
jgi:hypothetical protein